MINETVRAARDFLREHPEEAILCGAVQDGYEKREPHWPGRATIARFLAWPEQKVTKALADLAAIESGDVVEEATRRKPA